MGEMGMLGFAAVSVGAFLLWLGDRVTTTTGTIVDLATGDVFRRGHLAVIAMGAIVLFLVLWCGVSILKRLGKNRMLAYAYAYFTCRRDLKRVSRRWQC